jgi:hypothetical protein
MNAKLTLFLLIALFLLTLPTAGQASAGGIKSLTPISPSFNDALAVNSECNYCHTEGHDARSDVHGMLNHEEDRYAQYLESAILPEGFQKKSLLNRDAGNKCPRRNKSMPVIRIPTNQ